MADDNAAPASQTPAGPAPAGGNASTTTTATPPAAPIQLPKWATAALATNLIGNLIIVAIVAVAAVVLYRHFNPTPASPPKPLVIEMPVAVRLDGRSVAATLSLTLPPDVAPPPPPGPPNPPDPPIHVDPPAPVGIARGFYVVAVFSGAQPAILNDFASLSAAVGELGGHFAKADANTTNPQDANSAWMAAAKAGRLPALIFVNPDGSVYRAAGFTNPIPLPADADGIVAATKGALGRN